MTSDAGIEAGKDQEREGQMPAPATVYSAERVAGEGPQSGEVMVSVGVGKLAKAGDLEKSFASKPRRFWRRWESLRSIASIVVLES